MSDFEFERRLERMFAQPPRVDGGEAFAARVEARLERGWGMRRLFVGVAGAVGGVIAASQLIDAELLSRLQGVAPSTGRLLRTELPRSWLSGGLEQVALNGEVLWLTAGMLGLAIAFAATRWAEGA